MVCICFRTVTGTAISIVSFIGSIVLIIWLATAWSKTDEGYACVRHNNFTGWVGDEIITTAQRVYTGLNQQFICMQTTLQNMEFSHGGAGSSAPIVARTMDGMPLTLELVVEYEVRADALLEMLEEAGVKEAASDNENGNIIVNPERKLILVARSKLRNAASRFGALDYMGSQRQSIQAAMYDTLSEAFSEHYSMVNRVNLKTIKLPEEFEEKFREVEQLKMDVKMAHETLKLMEVNEQRLAAQGMAKLKGARKQLTIKAELEVTQEQLYRDGNLTNLRTRGLSLEVEDNTNRAKILIEAKAEVETARAQKATKLQEAARNVSLYNETASTERNSMTLSMEGRIQRERKEEDRRLERAKLARLVGQADIKVQQVDHKLVLYKSSASTNVTLAEIEATGLQQAAKVTRDHEPVKREMTGLMDTVGLTAEQVAQYLWYQSLQGNTNLSKVFLDYDKVPLLNEFQGDTGAGMTLGIQSGV